MNIRLVTRITSNILLLEAAALLLPIFISLGYRQQDWKAFALSALITAGVGLVMAFFSRKPALGLQAREGFVIVALSWILLSFFGALPFFFSGAIPNMVDCIFETISGFTTTGASILAEVELLPRGILFWRSFTHWIGGMGVLILFMALLPSLGERSIQLLRAESPGPSPSKLVPRIGNTAKILYAIYAAMTAAEIIALLIAGMPLYDSVVHSFGSAGTGGFSIRNASIGAYNSVAIDVIIGVFMLLFGVNFLVYFQIIKRQFTKLRTNSELKLYLGFAVVSTAIITANILPQYSSVGMALNHAFFQVSSVMTTTGYATTDFNLWPELSKGILVVLMLAGASAGSTGGGVKMIRVSVLCKSIVREARKIIHPRSVCLVRVDGAAMGEDVLRGVSQFFSAYIFIIAGAALVVSLDNFDFVTNLTAVISCISNIGPGLALVGPTGNFGSFSVLSKLVLSMCMLVGRLEIFPILVLLMPGTWRKR